MAEKNDKEEEKEVNWFVRWLIVLFSLFLLAGVTTSFLLKKPPYDISPGIITIIGVIAILVLSEAFDNLSLGKLISLKREVKKKGQENDGLRSENSELRNLVLQFSANMQQSQVNTTIHTTKEFWDNVNGVVKAEDSDVVDKEGEEGECACEGEVPEANGEDGDAVVDGLNAEVQAPGVDEEQVERPPQAENPHIEDRDEIPAQPMVQAKRRFSTIASKKPTRLYEYAENVGFDYLVRKYGYIEREMRFSSEATARIDPISEQVVTYDGYCKEGSKERFFEIKIGHQLSPIAWRTIYHMLAKIYFYGAAKDVDARLVLLVVQIPDKFIKRSVCRGPSLQRVIQVFQPAIANKLLRIETLELEEEEVQQFLAGGGQLS